MVKWDEIEYFFFHTESKFKGTREEMEKWYPIIQKTF